jgi:hypothetical protein
MLHFSISHVAPTLTRERPVFLSSLTCLLPQLKMCANAGSSIPNRPNYLALPNCGEAQRWGNGCGVYLDTMDVVHQPVAAPWRQEGCNQWKISGAWKLNSSIFIFLS